MQKKFLSSVFLFLFFNLLTKPFWVLGVDVGVQNRVGVEEYGLYFVIFNFSFLFNILLDLGITNFNNRNIAQNNQLVTKHLSGIVSLKLLLGILFVVVTLLAGWVLGYDSRQFYFLLWLCLNQFLISFITYLRSNLSALLMFKTDSLMSVLDRVLMTIFCSILLWGHVTHRPFQIEWFIYCQTAAYVITAIIAFTAVAHKVHLKKLTWNPIFSLMLIKKSLPFASLVLLMTFYNRIDSVMLELILPNRVGNIQAGMYAAAYRLLDAVNMISYWFAVPLLPIFATMLKKREDVRKITKLAFTLVFIIAVSIAISFSFRASDMMSVLYRDHVSESAAIFQMLIFCFIPISTTYIFGTLLTANNSLKYLNLIALGGMVLNIGLNFILIPHFNAFGSAFASLTTQSLTALVQFGVAFYVFKFKRNFSYIFRLAAFVVAIILFNMLLIRLDVFYIYSFVLVFVFAVISAFLLQLLDIRGIKQFLKK